MAGRLDSLPCKLNEDRCMLLLSGRKAESAWSAVNKARVDKLMVAGQMHPAGTAAVSAAKSDGSWVVLNDVQSLKIPSGLIAEFAEYPNAAQHFDAFPRSVKRSILEWIKLAKRRESRQKRIFVTARPADGTIRADQARQ